MSGIQEEIEKDELIGKIAMCSKGVVGVITGRKKLDWGEAWIGERLEDSGNWSSKNPAILADSLEEYNKQFLEEFEFGE